MDYESGDSSDAYCFSDEEVIDFLDFFHEGEENVVIKNITTNDPFLTKLYSNHGHFRGFINEPIPNSDDVHMEDPDSSTLEPKHKVQRGDADGYQLWYEKNDWRQLLVFCSRDVTTGTSRDGEGSSRQCETPLASGKVKEKTVSPKWTKSKISANKLAKDKPICEFRLWASWMGSENSFQIKSLKAEHRCARNYNLGSLVTYKWIAHQFAKEIIADPFITLLKMKAAIREKFLINVSLGQCKRAKQRALFDFEGGLIEHYGRLWDYRQVVLDTNLGSTCILEEEETEHGNKYFHKMYICFKGVADGWKAYCRRVIGLDECFLKHTCKGELLTTLGRDANNQMYPIAWAVVRGLLDVVFDWLPNAKHIKCTRHVDANFKKKYSGVHLQRLFWSADTTIVEQHFYNKMEQIKVIQPEAHDYLVQRNPNSWCRAFFDPNSKCPAFENGIAESFNRAILVQRTKPIITMLEDVRLYIMQRLVHMNNKSMQLEDRIAPSIRKRLEILKEQQRLWTVIPSGFQELEVRRCDESYGEPDEGVDHWYSQEKWFEAYQFSIKPVYGSNMWKKQYKQPLLPPIIRRMPGRPKKNIVKAPGESNTQVSRVERQMTCSNCYEKGHNKRACDKDPVPKPPILKKQPRRIMEPDFSHYASNRGG
ncbi:hypothetical protein Tco_0922940 [Tanacetum coccineum]|uniref:Transposase n=1 Tax=Tanacetum coccineum TaxID=301880 RepID=A0ABQ5D2W1_9ASTR